MLAKPNKVIPNPLQCSCFGKENPKYNNKKKREVHDFYIR